jgi:hypothetical protein
VTLEACVPEIGISQSKYHAETSKRQMRCRHLGQRWEAIPNYTGDTLLHAVMDHFFSLIGLSLDMFGEALFEICAELLASAIERAGRRVITTSRNPSSAFTLFFLALFGTAAGVLSVVVLPHPLFHRSRLHGGSLLISPVVTGSVMFGLGWLEREFGGEPPQIGGFWTGFIFALAMASARFLLVR